MKRSKSVFCSLAALFVSLSINTVWNGTAGAANLPKFLAGHLLVHPRKSLAFGSLVTRSDLRGGAIYDQSYFGKYGYGQADIGIYEYPVSTTNHGRRWRIAGQYFNLDDTSGFGAGNSPSNIVTLSSRIAVAYRRGDIIGPDSAIFVTIDSGRKWYITYAPGSVKKIATVIGGSNSNNTVLVSLAASVSSMQDSGKERTYTSLDGGRSWSLVISLQNSSNASISLRAARNVDGLRIQLPRGWPIVDRHSCSLSESSVLTNVPPDWLNIQCPASGTGFETTIRIGHFILKSGCCVSSVETTIGGKSSTELRFANGLIYGVEWHNPEVSIQLDYSPYEHMSAIEVEKDRTEIRAVLNSAHVI